MNAHQAPCSALPPASHPPEIHVALTHSSIDVSSGYSSAVRPGAGAVSLFVGTTRDSFQGRPVTRLEYEGYEGMACRVMREIGEEAAARAVSAHGQNGQLAVVLMVHRLGPVPIGEASVLIAVSSAHRAPALEACAWLIDALKARVPVWKREVYGDTGEGEWKVNAEAVQLAATPALHGGGMGSR